MELLDRHLQELTDKDPKYEPYFIYVVWPSVARPLTDIGHAVLPFGLDKGIEPLTSLLDTGLFQIPSGYKESLNAFSVALGTRYPKTYEQGLKELGQTQPTQPSDEKNPSPPHCGPVEPRGEKAVDLYEIDTSGQMGRGCPLSALLVHVLRWRLAENPDTHIHLVGHSYGAKVVTLAGMEAIRLQQTLGQPQSDQEEKVEAPLPPEKSIASLVLFNPAFHPRELRYLFASHAHANEVSLLQNISRKAIVYSTRDHATGLIFDLGQVVFSNRFAQQAKDLTYFTDMLDDSLIERFGENPLTDLSLAPLRLYTGLGILGYAVLSGPLEWFPTKAINIIPDWLSHITQSDLYDFEWSKGSALPKVVARGFVNFFDYWVPIFRFMGDDPEKMGILRTNIPALGSIGMNRLAAGPGTFPRWRWNPNKTAIDELIGKDAAPRPDTDRRKPKWDFCVLAAEVRPLDITIDRRYFYSYDATSVMDTGFFPFLSLAGSHGDVRETAPPDEKNCYNKKRNGQPLEKRGYVFNFVYNFTRGLPP